MTRSCQLNWAAPPSGSTPIGRRWSRSTQPIRATMPAPTRPAIADDDRARDGDRRAGRRPRRASRRRSPRRGRGAGRAGHRRRRRAPPSGARVRISTGSMSVRWWPSPARNVGHLAEHDPPVHAQQVGGGQDHHERRDGRGARVAPRTSRRARGTRRRTRTGRAGRPRRTRRTRRPRRRPASAPTRPPILAIVRSWVRS